MIKSTALDEISKLFRRSTENTALQATLELLPQAAIMIDYHHKIITLVNNKAINLTAYSREELSGKTLLSLFPNINLPPENSIQKKHHLGAIKLIQHSGIPIEAATTFNFLDNSKQSALLLFDSPLFEQHKEVEFELQKHRWQALQLLAQAPQQSTFEKAKLQILQAGQLLTGANLIAIYMANQKNGILYLDQIRGTDSSLIPLEIPVEDIKPLHAPHLWKTGERTQNFLTLNASTKQINHLASIPLIKDGKIEFLLVIADKIAAPSPSLPELLSLLIQTLKTSLHNFNLLSSLNQKLKSQDHLLSINEAIKDIVNDGIIFVSPELKIIEINPKAEDTLGYKNQEVMGAPLENILIGSQSLMPVVHKAIQTEVVQDLGDVNLHRRDGHTLLAHLRATPITVNKELVRTAIVITDISTHEEFRQRTQQLEQRALLGEVSAIFAHEVRNPINNISTGLQVMKYQFEDDAVVQEQIERLLQDCDRLTHLMASTLTFSKSLEYKMEPHDIKNMLENYLARMEPRMTKAKIDLQTHFSSNLPQIYGDKRALEQVFSNIINNAIQVMSEEKGGILGIKVAQSDELSSQNRITIDISDTGPGIPEATLLRIFQPFYTTHQNGTGLGLTIAQKIINAHSGQISVESFPGGTVFKILLPIASKY